MQGGGRDEDADSALAAPLADEMQSGGWSIAFPMSVRVWGR